MQLEARDKRALIIGAVVVVLLLAYLLWPRASDQSGVELVSADQRQGGTSAAPVQVQPPSNPAPAPVPTVAAAPAATVPEDLRLTGVAGNGAIFSFQDGSQRYIGRGREVTPGVVLQAVRLRDVILASGPTSYRLGFNGQVMALAPPAATAAAAPTLPVSAPPPAPNTGGADAEAYRQALVQRQGGQGYTVRPGANLPALRRAGIQPGDTILSVNGAALNEDVVNELARFIQSSPRTEFEVERNGQRMRLAIDTSR